MNEDEGGLRVRGGEGGRVGSEGSLELKLELVVFDFGIVKQLMMKAVKGEGRGDGERGARAAEHKESRRDCDAEADGRLSCDFFDVSSRCAEGEDAERQPESSA